MAAACSRRAFEESAAYLAQVTDRTPVSRLLGISWVAVGNIVERVVARRLDGAPDQGMGARLSTARWGQVSESARSARPGLPCGRSPAAGVPGSARCPRRIIAVRRRPMKSSPAITVSRRRPRRRRRRGDELGGRGPVQRLGGRGLRRGGEGAHVAPSATFPDWGQSVSPPRVDRLGTRPAGGLGGPIRGGLPARARRRRVAPSPSSARRRVSRHPCARPRRCPSPPPRWFGV